MGNFQVRYDSRVVNYERKLFIKLATGLVVMGDNSCSRVCGFESRRHLLDGHFFTLICCKNCNVCLNRSKKRKKRPGLAHFLKNSYFMQFGQRKF